MKSPNHYKLDLQLFAEEEQNQTPTPKPEDNYLQVIKELKAEVEKEINAI